MKYSLKERLLKDFNFTENDWELTKPFFYSEELNPKAYFLKEGKISDKIAVIESGLLRTFVFDENGNEITTQFHVQGSLAISHVSFNRQVPARENIVAIESSELIIFTYKNMQELIQKVPAWQQIPLAASEYKNKQKEKRILELQTLSAKERYLRFLDKYPQVCRSATVGQIASYLGIDIATLSRIRSKI